MTCEAAENLVESYLDDELDASLAAQMREHLASCSSCAAAHAGQLELRAGIREQAPYYRAPDGLRDRITVALRQADRPAAGPWRWLALAASLLLAVSLAWNVAQFRAHDAGETILASHIRSLMANHLLDVPSSDQHTVKPWFNGKLDFSPDVKDFAGQGFPLLGGRLDYLDGRPVAALVYQRRRHVINLFTWPSAESGGATELSRNGYRAIHWTSAGMTYWAVSDLGAGELRQFANLYQ
jgi:mycothiol system anti-sigma-R factor